MLTVEQIVASNKANLDTLFGLTTKAFAGVEKMVELNVTAAKAALAESAEHAKASMSVKDAQEFMALQAGLLQPMAEKSAAYSRHLYDIAASALPVSTSSGRASNPTAWPTAPATSGLSPVRIFTCTLSFFALSSVCLAVFLS